MKTLNYAMIKLTIYLIIGIWLGQFFHINQDDLVLLSVGLLLLFIGLNFLLKNVFHLHNLLGVYLCVATVIIGLLSFSLHEQKHHKLHYLNSFVSPTNTSYDVTFSIREELKPSRFHDKYVISIHSFNGKRVKGLCLLNISKDSLQNHPKVGQRYFSAVKFQKINAPLNPYQFDYASYMERQYIYHQLTVASDQLYLIENQVRSVFSYAAQLRERIQTHLKKHQFSSEELAIINALLLGQRQELSQEEYERYAQAGAIHILAISGLHVGLILLILQYILKPLEFITYGNTLKVAIILILIWSYAIIAGLSASVVRAVTMFSLFAIAMQMKRPTNVYNTLAISAFLLLLFNPNYLYDVGFQLSYVAVLSIVTLEPMLRKIWHPKLKIINFYWRIFTVTLAAQIGVLPLSLFYFHQFPGLFFLSNLVIIPCLGSILGIGLLVLTLSFFNSLPEWLAMLYSYIIELLNTFVAWISEQEAFVFQNISFDLSQVLFSYVMISLFILLISKKTAVIIRLILLSIIFYQCYLLFISCNKYHNAFIVFHKSRYSVIGIKEKNNLEIHSNLQDSIVFEQSLLETYKVGEDIQVIKTDTLRDLYLINDLKILIIDSLGVYGTKTFKPDLILLRNSPKINLSRMIDSVNPKLIISDGSNYRSYQDRWAQTCQLKKIPFHQTGKKGAFITRY